MLVELNHFFEPGLHMILNGFKEGRSHIQNVCIEGVFGWVELRVGGKDWIQAGLH